jgi:CubicO group peptidase (beta-lactamase class C family)
MHSPSSNLHSSVVDMARWAIANMSRGELDGRRILRDATYDVMWKPAREIGQPGGTARNAGISWFLSEHRGHASVGHSGGDTGYRTDIAMLPERKIAVVWMTNCDWGGNRAITSAALDVALGLKPAPIVMKRRVRER